MSLSYKQSEKSTKLGDAFNGRKSRSNIITLTPYPKIATIPHQAWQEVSSFDVYKPLKDFVSSKKTKYGCLAFWIVLVVTIAIVMSILWAMLHADPDAGEPSAKCYLGGSGCCKEPELVGDGKCNPHLMNQTICNYDNGDCCQMEKGGNRVCDDFNNSPLCSEYDGGDCRPPNIEDWAECPHNPKMIGDGICDDHLKFKAECNHDGGDCCEESLLKNGDCEGFNKFPTCENYDQGDCRPSSKTEWLNCPFNPDYIGDGICFAHFKSKAECNHDGGDCCEESLLANGNCEGFNNFSTCENYDKGDCRPSSKTEWLNCPFNPDYIGDGICFDHFKTNAGCNHDGGDCCDQSLLANGNCEGFNNFPTCENYDKGDCRPSSKTEWPECPFNPEYIGDGTCFDHFKTKAECNHDDGDCCDQSLLANENCDEINNIPTCENYDKGDCRPPGKTEWLNCPFNPDFIGDGICFDHFKTKAECNHDGGDCCDQNLIGDRFCNDFNNFETCQLYDGDDCPPPDVTDWLECPHNPKFIGDETCDYHLNHTVECNYDGSDCSDKYLIAGGYVDGSDKLTEVVEYFETTSTPSFGQLPSKRHIPVGAMFGNAPILCGGWDGSGNSLDTCISYQDSEWSQSHSMVQKRVFAAGVKINSTTFWILGGIGYNYYDSTEFIIQGQNNGVPGPKLPYKLESMCAVKLSESEIFVIGGYGSGGFRNEVWIYDPQNGFARTQGPSLTTARGYHSCSTMRHGEKTVIIAAGGYNYGQYLDSVEIYDPTDNTWYSGPSLPYGLQSSAMAKSSDGRGVLLFGGMSDETYFEKRILELRTDDNSWTILDKTLEKGRSNHVVIKLPTMILF